MQSISNAAYIHTIIQSIDIDDNRTLWLDGQKQDPGFENPYLQQPNYKMLFQNLTSLIYNHFYCKNKTHQEEGTKPPNEDEIQAFIAQLSLCNQSKSFFDEGWTITDVDMQGQVIAQKGNLLRYVLAGEYLNQSSFAQSPAVQDQISIYARKEHKSPGLGFYYVFGNTIGEDHHQLVRIYFNISPVGIGSLIKLVTTTLNEVMIPFMFKCLNHPYFYSRSDSAVLYVEKRYVNLVLELLRDNYQGLQPHLQSELPAFTKFLAPGVAFAENPIKQDESFGTHCCKMIAQGILDAHRQQLRKSDWFEAIKRNIEGQHHYPDLELLYCNPDSHFPYHFPNFN